MTEVREYTLSGKVSNFALKGQSNHRYIAVTIPFGEARDIFAPDFFNVKNGKGEQRQATQSHVNKLRRAMETDEFTPCCVHAGMKKHHQAAVQYDEATGVASISVASNDKLPFINGNHRASALENIRKAALDANDLEQLASVDALPVTAMVLIDGNPQKDFLNLQIGKAVDGSHMLCLRTQTKSLPDKHQSLVKLAIDVAKKLNTDVDSPFVKQIRFDTGSMAPLPISSLCAKGASDLGTSLVGLAKLLIEYEVEDKKSEPPVVASTWGASLVSRIYTLLKERSPEVLGNAANRLVLTPPPDGTKGSATMLLGVANCVAYYLLSEGRLDITPDDENVIVEAVGASLNRSANGNFSGSTKRDLVGIFAQALFANRKCDKHEGVPSEFVKAFSTSAFSVTKIAKQKKAKATTTQKVDLASTTVSEEAKKIDAETASMDEFQIPDDAEIQSVDARQLVEA